jgi:hypothetical protein
MAIISKIERGKTKYLLCNSVLDFGKYTGFFYPPSGTMKSDNISEIDCLIEKVRLETGLDIVPIEKLAQTPADVSEGICNWWKCEATSYTLKLDPNRVKEAIWLTTNEIEKADNIWPATKKFFKSF